VLAILKAGGVKQAEIDATGIADWLLAQGRPLTREEVGDYLRLNDVRLGEILKGGPPDARAIEAAGRLEEATTALSRAEEALLSAINRLTPGRRLTLETDMTILGQQANADEERQALSESGAGRRLQDAVGRPPVDAFIHAARTRRAALRSYNVLAGGRESLRYGGGYSLPGGQNHVELLFVWPEPQAPKDQAQGGGPTPEIFRSPHWDEPNVMAHLRGADYETADGQRVFLANEIQTDYAAQL
jgi:hypothetical protein